MKAFEEFIGRHSDLQKLNDLNLKKTPDLIVIKGRRRIGKSRLISEYAAKENFLSFSGLAPTPDTTAQDQRDEFAQQLSTQLNLPKLAATNWSELFSFLAKQVTTKRTIILLDEISWMGSKDPTFLAKLKIAWDNHFNQKTNVKLVLCGSISSWIEENILRSTAFFGRVSCVINLKPLSLPECNDFLNALGFKHSTYEKLMVLSLTGGIPWYLELINPKLPAKQNIQRLCFEESGTLLNEYDRIFNDLFEKRAEIYKKIVNCLKTGSSEYDEISKELNYSRSGQLTEYLDHLTQAGFVSRDYTWSIQTGQHGKLSKFRLSDNYLRFYLKYIQPNLTKIKNHRFDDVEYTSLPGIETQLGLQFESLILENANMLIKQLSISLLDVVADGPFFQRKNTKQTGCQIDYLIQTKQKTLYLCEIKFSRNPIGTRVIKEVESKIKAIKIPRGFAVLPVLIYVGELTEELCDNDFFYRVINIQSLLNQ